MRILGLHGSGTSAEIFEAQSSSFRHKLEELGHEYVFDFIDAPVPDEAGPGVKPFFDGPFWSWLPEYSVSAVKEASESLLQYLREQKQPYDILMGFSQGCNLIAASIFYLQTEHPEEPLPFRGAIFICGGCPLYVFDEFMPVSDEAKAIYRDSLQALDDMRGETSDKIKNMMATGARVDLWDRPTALWDGKEKKTASWGVPKGLQMNNVFGLDMSDLPSSVQIGIPTVFVYGSKDPFCGTTLQVAMLCAPEVRQIYDHASGHDLPRLSSVSADIAKAIIELEQQINQPW